MYKGNIGKLDFLKKENFTFLKYRTIFSSVTPFRCIGINILKIPTLEDVN